MTIYIAGPMTGLPDNNYPAFRAAAIGLGRRQVTTLRDGLGLTPNRSINRDTIRELHASGMTDTQIAEHINRDRPRPANRRAVAAVRLRLGLEPNPAPAMTGAVSLAGEAPEPTEQSNKRLREAADRTSPLSKVPYTSLDLALVRDAAYRASEVPEPSEHQCENCQTCGVHGNSHLKCCGCYDGVCCQESDSEPQGMAEMIERSSLGTPDAQALRATVSDEKAHALVAEAHRRSEMQDDESHLRGRWSNGDPVHIITDGVDRWIAPNHNGATWIADQA